jgi:hypothetical protein
MMIVPGALARRQGERFMTAALLLSVASTLPAQPPDEFPPEPIGPPVLLAPAPTPLPPAPALLPARPMSHFEFACAFEPTPGLHKVTLIHPVSKCPVSVCFELPGGCARVKAGKRSLVFDYGKHEVAIVFRVLGGGSRVDVVTR